jgi:hypothetical protein
MHKWAFSNGRAFLHVWMTEVHFLKFDVVTWSSFECNDGYVIAHFSLIPGFIIGTLVP